MGTRVQVGLVRLVLTGGGRTVRGEYYMEHSQLSGPPQEVAKWLMERIAAAIAQWFDGVPVHTVGVCLTGIPRTFVSLVAQHLPKGSVSMCETLHGWHWRTEEAEELDRWEVIDGQE